MVSVDKKSYSASFTVFILERKIKFPQLYELYSFL